MAYGLLSIYLFHLSFLTDPYISLSIGKCLSFAVYYDETSLEILVLQGWQSQADLDAFTSSQSFSQLKNKWNGILSAPPANHIYHQRVL